MARYIHQVHIADGFADDCEELVHRCSQHRPLSYLQFTKIWKEMNMSSIYQGRSIGAEIAELSEELLFIAKRYMLTNTSNFEECVAGVFLVYSLLHTQPFKRFAALRLIPADMPAVKRIEAVARRVQRLDVLYTLGSILIVGPTHCHAENREYGFDNSLRKYLEGITGIDRMGIRPKGVFYRQNEELDIIRELTCISRLYEDAKSNILDESGRQDVNLSFSDKELPAQLETSLKRVINGLIDDDREDPSSPQCNERIDRVRSIKQRAMANAIAPIKHLTTVHDKTSKKNKSDSPQKASPIKKAKKAKKTISKAGKVKTGSPRKPVTSKSPRKPKEKTNKKKTIKRKKKRTISSSESSDSTIILDDVNDDEDDDMDFEDDDDNINTWIAKEWAKEKNKNIIETISLDEIKSLDEIEPDIDKLVEKEYDVHIDTMPILIKNTTSKAFEIEFIDFAENVSPSKKKQKKGNKAKEKNEKPADINGESSNTIELNGQVESNSKNGSNENSPKSKNDSNRKNGLNSKNDSNYKNGLDAKNVSNYKNDFNSKNDSKSKNDSNSTITDIIINGSLKSEPHYKLRRREKRELKNPVLKSKFKKMGLQDLVTSKEDDESPTFKELM